ncbi:ankyrin repeat domain-containing protein [Motilimonas sp. E26]|uniref:ankyrin repeat domain-containing protein n=1 Tax=Motilimonas TaxID=1914248 RepID=UPI001E637E76|nr:ankyrin repeat domain-containing protein [Motilimonas sp. E26]MCE0556988.1 hypothetical protein [Motilimonas sp. E26]
MDYTYDFRDLSNEDIIEIIAEFEDIDLLDDSGDTVLLWACKEYNFEVLEYSLSKRANANFINECGEAPLHQLIEMGEYKEELAISLIQKLLEYGADIELRAYMDKTPFLKACSRNSIKIIEFLANNGANTKANISEYGKILDGNFFANIFANSPDVKECIRNLVNS